MNNGTATILRVDDQPSRLLTYEVMPRDLGAILAVGEAFESKLPK